MRHSPLIAAALLAAAAHALAQTPSAVASFTPGSGQNAGQEPQYYPANVLGLPDTTARRTVPATDPAQILCLGAGGVIVLRFDGPIVDAPGPDFTVFENAFYYTIGGVERIYAEPAEVSVSRDGVRFVAYPFDTLTLAGCAGTAPTYGDQDPFDPRVSGGNSFDLAQLGIDSIHFVRLTDKVMLVANNLAHPLWDPTLSGFDLDAVIALPASARHAGAEAPQRSEWGRAVTIHPNPASAIATVALPDGARAVTVRDIEGRELRRVIVENGESIARLDVRPLATGTYIVEARSADGARAASLLRVVR
jgi:hypothetical protein